MISGVNHHCRHVAYCPYCVHSVQQLLQVCLQATKYLNNPLTPFLFLLPFPLLPELLSSPLSSLLHFCFSLPPFSLILAPLSFPSILSCSFLSPFLSSLGACGLSILPFHLLSLLYFLSHFLTLFFPSPFLHPSRFPFLPLFPSPSLRSSSSSHLRRAAHLPSW